MIRSIIVFVSAALALGSLLVFVDKFQPQQPSWDQTAWLMAVFFWISVGAITLTWPKKPQPRIYGRPVFEGYKFSTHGTSIPNKAPVTKPKSYPTSTQFTPPYGSDPDMITPLMMGLIIGNAMNHDDGATAPGPGINDRESRPTPVDDTAGRESYRSETGVVEEKSYTPPAYEPAPSSYDSGSSSYSSYDSGSSSSDSGGGGGGGD